MVKLLIPIISIIVALALYFFFIQDTLERVAELKIESAQFDETLKSAQELENTIERLTRESENIQTSDLDKLEILLPDHIDSVRFIYDLNTIAEIHNKTLGEVSVEELKGDRFTSTIVTFSINGTYSELLAFLSDLELSLRIIDVQSISFKVTNDSDKDGIDYTIVIATHVLK
ncbi:type 4a pilus biogenesis protein PilO [Patescibacteria group bacterium]|nr:type 4a pilus biogenesis protein PilO [Patescibacteria group bacterium]